MSKIQKSQSAIKYLVRAVIKKSTSTHNRYCFGGRGSRTIRTLHKVTDEEMSRFLGAGHIPQVIERLQSGRWRGVVHVLYFAWGPASRPHGACPALRALGGRRFAKKTFFAATRTTRSMVVKASQSHMLSGAPRAWSPNKL